MDINFNGIPVFKGLQKPLLQKPLEFMGIRGRFLTYAAGAISISFLGFLLSSILFGKLVGFIVMVCLAAVGIISIYVKQRSGLHSKKRLRGNFYYCRMYDH